MFRRVLQCAIFLAISGLFGASQEVWNRPVKFGLVTPFSLRHVGTELGQSVKPSPDDRSHYLDALGELGISTIRDAIINWAEIEPEPGSPYDFGYLDDLVRKASAHGIEVVGLVYFYPPWATIGVDRPWKYPNDGRYKLPMRKNEAAFRRFVHAAVERYCGCSSQSLHLKIPVRHYVFMNEPEGYAGEALEPDEYAHWLRIFTEEVRTIDPHIKVIAPALAAPGAWHRGYLRGEFLDRLLGSAELRGTGWPYFDICDYHPYPAAYSSSEGDLYAINVATSYVRSILARHGLQLPLWITELGDSSADEVTQADHVIEYIVHAASTGVERVYVFGMADYGKDHWGLLKDTPSGEVPLRKASFVAYKTFLSKVSDNQRVDFMGPGRYCIFRKDKAPVYVLWAVEGSPTSLYFLHGSLVVTDLMGHMKRTDAEHLELGVHPLFVEPQR